MPAPTLTQSAQFFVGATLVVALPGGQAQGLLLRGFNYAQFSVGATLVVALL